MKLKGQTTSLADRLVITPVLKAEVHCQGLACFGYLTESSEEKKLVFIVNKIEKLQFQTEASPETMLDIKWIQEVSGVRILEKTRDITEETIFLLSMKEFRTAFLKGEKFRIKPNNRYVGENIHINWQNGKALIITPTSDNLFECIISQNKQQIMINI